MRRSSSDIMNPEKANKSSTPVAAEPLSGRSNIIDPNLLYSNFPSQLLALQQQRDRLLALRDQQGGISNDQILAAAVQQQLMAASLNSSRNLPLYALGGGGSQTSQLGTQRGTPPPIMPGGVPQRRSSTGSMSALTSPSRPGGAEGSSQDILPEANAMIKIPCQARGMAADHNTVTAYFEVPNDTKHGQHLYCSHSSCRASGVKFRFCKFCRKPVTKQNFRSRHLHADLLAPGQGDTISIVNMVPGRKRKSDQEKQQSKLDFMCQKGDTKRSKGVGGLIPGSGSSESVFSIDKDFARSRSSLHGSNAVSRLMSLGNNSMSFPPMGQLDTSMSAVDSSSPVATSQDTAGGISMIAAKQVPLHKVSRKRRWIALLSERPKGLDGGDVGSWLTTVLQVSDKGKEWKMAPGILTTEMVDSDDSGNVGPKGNKQFVEWNQLLHERPDAKDADDKKTTEWMVKVLRVSCKS